MSCPADTMNDTLGLFNEHSQTMSIHGSPLSPPELVYSDTESKGQSRSPYQKSLCDDEFPCSTPGGPIDRQIAHIAGHSSDPSMVTSGDYHNEIAFWSLSPSTEEPAVVQSALPPPLPEGSRYPKFAVIHDMRFGKKIRLNTDLDKVNLKDIPAAHCREYIVFPRSWRPVNEPLVSNKAPAWLEEEIDDDNACDDGRCDKLRVELSRDCENLTGQSSSRVAQKRPYDMFLDSLSEGMLNGYAGTTNSNGSIDQHNIGRPLGGVVDVERTTVTVKTQHDKSIAFNIPRRTVQMRRREELLNELSTRFFWHHSKPLGNRRILVQKIRESFVHVHCKHAALCKFTLRTPEQSQRTARESGRP